MHPRQPIPADLAEAAALQAGVVTREQALAAGLSRHVVARLVATDAWYRLVPGLFAVAPAPVPWLGWAWGGVLLGGAEARLGGRAAAHLHGLVELPPQTFTILVPNAGTRPRVDGPWQIHRERPGVRTPRTVGGPPRLCVEDVVLDLVGAETDERRIVGWVTAAVQNRLTTTDRLSEAMAARFFLPHRAFLARLLGDVALGAQSPLEVDYLRDVERPHGLPVGQRQIRRDSTEVDVPYDEFALLVELDGRKGHEGEGRFRDMRRDNASTSDGLATLRYSGVRCPRDAVCGRPAGMAQPRAARSGGAADPVPSLPAGGLRICAVNLAASMRSDRPHGSP